MKNYDQNTNPSTSGGRGRYRKEWAVAIFSLLMATALPALAATVAGITVRSGEAGFNEASTVCLCRHDTAEREELTFRRLLALSLAATNGSDTPAASLEAQAILLRSRGVWWMDYCTLGEGEGGIREDPSDNGESGETENAENGVRVEEHGRKGQEGGEKGAPSPPILCDSPTHGLPYLSYEELVALWGEAEADARISAAERAVKLTDGQVLCYEGEVVPALLHHSSGGVTRSVESLPWLSAVPTPEAGDEAIRRFSAEEVRHALAARFGLLLSADPTKWGLTVHTYSDGRVETVKVSGESLPGVAVAEALSLPSATFSVQVSDDTLTFVCRGEGSGCGLSREGAAIYAAGGLSCGEILAHYYPDCTVGVMGG